MLKEIILTLNQYKKISLGIILICLSGACVFAMSRPSVYQSELTFAVKMNQPSPTMVKNNERLQEIARIVESDEVRKPISINDVGNKYNIEMLNADYRSCNMRVQNLDTLCMFKIFAHGATPEEAQRNCAGIYEHFSAFSAKYNAFQIDTNSPAGSLLEYVEHNLDKAKNDYEDYLAKAGGKNDLEFTSIEQEKIRLQRNYFRLEDLHQQLMTEELLAKWHDSWQVELIDVASLPSQPVTKRTGFIICLGAMLGAFVCLLFGIVMTVKHRKIYNTVCSREISNGDKN